LGLGQFGGSWPFNDNAGEKKNGCDAKKAQKRALSKMFSASDGKFSARLVGKN
jgi:hypothetical protein